MVLSYLILIIRLPHLNFDRDLLANRPFKTSILWSSWNPTRFIKTLVKKSQVLQALQNPPKKGSDNLLWRRRLGHRRRQLGHRRCHLRNIRRQLGNKRRQLGSSRQQLGNRRWQQELHVFRRRPPLPFQLYPRISHTTTTITRSYNKYSYLRVWWAWRKIHAPLVVNASQTHAQSQERNIHW